MHVEIDIRDYYSLKEMRHYADRCAKVLEEDDDLTRKWEGRRFGIIRDRLDIVIDRAQIKHTI